MAVYFLDSSGVVKRYVTENGTAWVRHICNPAAGNDIYTAHVTGAESAAAIMRRVRQGGLSIVDAAIAITDLQAHLRSAYTAVFVTNGLVQRAIDLVQHHPLRGFDAVQLASALQVKAECAALGIPVPIFVSADNDLNAAAAAEGLAVDNPNAHP
ncbi:MAG: type II toxin-antitoxin system VapC family toxin [Armatimonadota bacterium]|nr:type II toxin-antitoxin system VapC family toxin [Armatimonadota bacterium]